MLVQVYCPWLKNRIDIIEIKTAVVLCFNFFFFVLQKSYFFFVITKSIILNLQCKQFTSCFKKRINLWNNVVSLSYLIRASTNLSIALIFRQLVVVFDQCLSFSQSGNCLGCNLWCNFSILCIPPQKRKAFNNFKLVMFRDDERTCVIVRPVDTFISQH